MKRYKYRSYEEYLIFQYATNRPRIPWTLQKDNLRAADIQIIKKYYKGKRVLCLGCRHDKEVDTFIEHGFEAIGIDILPTQRQIHGDINKLENYFNNDSFEIAYAAHSIEHTNRPIHFLKMIRKICIEGAYFVIPIRDHPDIEEPIYFDVMHSKDPRDLLREFTGGLGTFNILEQVTREDPNLPSGAEMAFVLKWK